VGHLEQAARERNMPLLEACGHAEALPQLGPRAQQAVAQFVRLMDSLRAEMEASTLTELTRAVIEKSGYRLALEAEKTIKARGKIENIDELLSATQEYEEAAEAPSLAGFLESIALLTSADRVADGTEAVTLMTLHSAKGLEFPIVFVVGLEEGLFPLARASLSDNPMELEEERRLCYVGITRAKEQVFLSSAELRTIFGRTAHTMASRFLEDIPEDLIERHGPASPRMITWGTADITRSPSAQQILDEAGVAEPPFRAGDRVRHPNFGDGMVVSVSGDSEAGFVVSVAFPKGGIRKLDPGYARLERVG
jgi:DNA helicase-2/ATP-dependent DNA helicase PcrA